MTHRFKYLKPDFQILESKRPKTIKSYRYNENSVHWWKYAIKTVIKL